MLNQAKHRDSTHCALNIRPCPKENSGQSSLTPKKETRVSGNQSKGKRWIRMTFSLSETVVIPHRYLKEMSLHGRREQQRQSLSSGIRGQLRQLTQFAFKAKASEFLHALPGTAAHGSLRLPFLCFCTSRADDVSPYLYIQVDHTTHEERDKGAIAEQGSEKTLNAQIVFQC